LYQGQDFLPGNPWEYTSNEEMVASLWSLIAEWQATGWSMPCRSKRLAVQHRLTRRTI
jgi:hypothetical protein